MTKRLMTEEAYLAHQARLGKPMGKVPAGPVCVLVPIRTYSTLNSRVHWAERAKRTKREREAVTLALLGRPLRIPCTVTLTRIGPRKLDGDNLQGALKGVRDAVATAFRLDDADPRITWEYGQEKGDYAVRIEIKEV